MTCLIGLIDDEREESELYCSLECDDICGFLAWLGKKGFAESVETDREVDTGEGYNIVEPREPEYKYFGNEPPDDPVWNDRWNEYQKEEAEALCRMIDHDFLASAFCLSRFSAEEEYDF